MGEGKTTARSCRSTILPTDIAGRIVAAIRKVMATRLRSRRRAGANGPFSRRRHRFDARDLVAALQPEAGERILDIGSGMAGRRAGSPAPFRCHVTGIDLTSAFCRAAEQLNVGDGPRRAGSHC